MQCSKCKQEYPSLAFFRADGICSDCFAKLSESERSEIPKSELIEPLTSLIQPSLARAVKRLGYLLLIGAVMQAFLAVIRLSNWVHRQGFSDQGG